MTFDEILAQVLDLLQRQGRVSYRALKRRFDLDDAYLEDLKAEIIQAQRLASDEDGAVLVWTGATPAQPPEPAPPTPQRETPPDTPADQATWRGPLAAGREAPEAERRQLTVLFCDLVDSTALASRLDPEDLREVVRLYQETCAAVIQRFEGHIAQYLGDGLLVYFGYPLAHEDDAQRAVRTGLGIVEAIKRLQARFEREQGVRLAVRLGIHTGLVVIGSIGAESRREQLALGETPNLAARLQGLAAPDTVVISVTTHRLVQGLFVCRGLGSQTLKGIPTPVPVYHVLGESESQSRLEVAGPTGLTPLVGREPEVALLRERWAQAKDGHGQVVLLSGEAGIGKSRLVQMLKAQVADEPHVRWECRCSPYYRHSALYPVIDLFQRILRFQEDEAPEAKLRKLEDNLAPYNVPLSEVVPLFASLLSVPLGDHYAPLTLSPERQKQKTLEAVLALLLALAAQRPVLFIVEDLHWIDASTLELLSLVIDQGPTARLLTVLAFRPEFQPPWTSRAHLTQLTLARLPRAQAEVMVTRVAGGKALPLEVHQQVVARTDGVPLFVEELTRMVLESGLLQEREDRYELTGPLPPLAIPTTLHDSLMARLDRLAAVKEVAQLGATLGRTFSYELLRAVTPLDEAALQQALAQFVTAELLYQRGVPPQATYLFKHALIQEAAYQSLLRSTRQQSHQRIAQVLAERFPETAETQPELLAHHYTEAGLSAPAVDYWQRAGQRALQRSAHVEAIAHLNQGLRVLTTLPETRARDQQEFTLRIDLGKSLIATKGWASPEAEVAYTRAWELCQLTRDASWVFAVLWGLSQVYIVRADLTKHREVGAQFLSLAEQRSDAILLAVAHWLTGVNLFHVGEFATGLAHLDQAYARYDPQHYHTYVTQFGVDVGVFALSYISHALWGLGYPDQAVQRSREALALAQEVHHPFSIALAQDYAAMLQQFHREQHTANTHAEIALTVCTEQGFAYYLAWATIIQGWVVAETGRREEGIAQMHQGLTTLQATGGGLRIPYYLALLAEAYGNHGEPGEGLHVLADAFDHVQHTGECWWEAELHRRKGELLLQGAGRRRQAAETPEACFHRALEVARRQQAKALELRAAMSLSRLWQRQGKRAEARQLLAEVYGWFTEGFDTADLQEARALLEELS